MSNFNRRGDRAAVGAIAIFLALFAHGSAQAEAPPPAHQHQHGMPRPIGACDGPDLKCAITATPAFDSRDRLWLVWTAASKVWVAHAPTPGGEIGPAVAVTHDTVLLDGGPDSRPKIAIDRQGRAIVSFTAVPGGGFDGQIFVSSSSDGGNTFSEPRRLDPNSPGHRFEVLQVMPNGRILAADVDKTNAFAANSAGAKYPGAALALSWSSDGGASFGPAVVAVDNTCECCRLAVALDPTGTAVIAFRDIFDGTTRDHAVITVAADGAVGPVRRVSRDEWVTDVCPHQGPALAVSPAGTYHVAWYTAGGARKGLFYARSTDRGATFSDPRPLGRAGIQASRAQVLAAAGGLYLAWKEFDGETSSIFTQTSHDDGASWSPPSLVASTKSRADHPLLLANSRGDAFLSWLTDAEGYRLIKLGTPP